MDLGDDATREDKNERLGKMFYQGQMISKYAKKYVIEPMSSLFDVQFSKEASNDSPIKEYVRFGNYYLVLGVLLDMHKKLDIVTSEVPQKHVLVKFSFDGHQPYKKCTGWVTFVIVIVDPRSKSPITGAPLFEKGKVQSPDHVYPVLQLVGKENKELFGSEIVKEFFEFIATVGKKKFFKNQTCKILVSHDGSFP